MALSLLTADEVRDGLVVVTEYRTQSERPWVRYLPRREMSLNKTFDMLYIRLVKVSKMRRLRPDIILKSSLTVALL